MYADFICFSAGCGYHGHSRPVLETTLPNMLFGMIGIFIVIGVIILATYGLNKAFSKKKKDDKDEK